MTQRPLCTTQYDNMPNPENHSNTKEYLKKIKNLVLAVGLFLLVAAFVVTLVSRINGKTPSLFGFSFYRISSDSMQPSLKVGDIILCRTCDPETLCEGDIITYEGRAGEFAGKNVTHRVVKTLYRSADGGYLVTKGDDNPAEDTPIQASQVKGVFVAKLFVLRFIYQLFVTPWGLVILFSLILLAYSGEIKRFFSFVTGYMRDNQTKK